MATGVTLGRRAPTLPGRVPGGTVKPSVTVRHWGRRGDPEGQEAVSERGAWRVSEAGDLAAGLSSGAAQPWGW